MEKLKMIRGSKKRAEEVKETLKRWGAKDVKVFSYTDENYYYFVKDEQVEWIEVTNFLLNYLNYEVAELSELKESDDEKIRKELINFFSKGAECDSSTNGIKDRNIIAWLEKQGEKNQKHFELKAGHWYFCHQAYCCRADDLTVKEGERFMCEEDGVVKGFVIKDPEKYFVEVSAPAPTDDEKKSVYKPTSKFEIGDWIVNNDERIAVPIQILKIEEYGYITSSGYTSFDKVKTDYHIWTIQDAKEGDVLAEHECLVLFKEIEGLNIRCYCTYHFMNNESFFVDTLQNKKAFTPATKEQRDLLFKKMKESGYEWDTVRNGLKKIKQ